MPHDPRATRSFASSGIAPTVTDDEELRSATADKSVVWLDNFVGAKASAEWR